MWSSGRSAPAARNALLGGAALAAALAGCSDTPTPDREAATWMVERSTVFGDADGPGALSQIFDVDVAPDGRVVLSEPQFTRVAAFAPDGTFLHEIGRRGEGPGEFLVPGALTWLADTLVVTDFRLGLGLFDLDGGFHGRVSFQIPTVGGSGFPVMPMAPLADGGVLALAPVATGAALSGAVSHEVWLRTDRGGAIEDTLLRLPLAGRFAQVRAGEGQGRSGQHPTAWGTLTAMPPSMGFLVAVDRAPAEAGAAEHTFRVVRVDLHGDTVASTEVSYVPVALTAVHRDSIAAAEGTAWAEAVGMAPGPAVDAYRDQVPWPDSWPPVTSLLVADDGSVWLRREGPVADSVAWDVLDAELDAVGRVHLPAALDVKVVTSGAVYGVELDDLDVPRVVRYAVRR